MINELDFRIKKNGEPYSQCFCRNPELIENYDKAINDITQTWECHHRLEIMPFSGKRISHKKLIEFGIYFDVQPEALIFLTEKEHKSLHMKGHQINKGRVQSISSREKRSKKLKGRVPWNKGKTWSNPKDKGKHWYTNGVDNIRCFECPDGFTPGRTITK